MIKVDGIHKSFGKVRAVRGVSFDAPDGKITGLLGPNGAGKSTTLRILYTVLKPDEGGASIDGYDVVDDSLAARKCIGALPHGAGLYPQLTARENIAYFAKLCDLDKAEIDDRVDNIVKLLEIEGFAERRTKGFSQGQRTKVSLARALVHDPQNILLDEPSNGLDVMATRSLRELILKLKDAGRCVLFSSHIMQEVAALCDDVCIIANGQVAIDDSIDGIRPCTTANDAFQSPQSVCSRRSSVSILRSQLSAQPVEHRSRHAAQSRWTDFVGKRGLFVYALQYAKGGPHADRSQGALPLPLRAGPRRPRHRLFDGGPRRAAASHARRDRSAAQRYLHAQHRRGVHVPRGP